MEQSQIITDFMQKDIEWLESIIKQYPQKIPVKVIAEHFGCAEESLRGAIENSPTFGIWWRKMGAVNKAYLIPTGLFIRWYCHQNFI